MSLATILYVRAAGLMRTMKNEEGQGMVEYGLILALIAVVCAVAFTSLGTGIASLVNGVVTSL